MPGFRRSYVLQGRASEQKSRHTTPIEDATLDTTPPGQFSKLDHFCSKTTGSYRTEKGSVGTVSLGVWLSEKRVT